LQKIGTGDGGYSAVGGANLDLAGDVMSRAKKPAAASRFAWLPEMPSPAMVFGWGLAGVAVGVSGLMSVIYGWSLGEASGMGLIFAAVAGMVTGIKATGLALTFGRGHRFAGFCMLPLVVLAFMYAVTAGHQFAAENLYRAANQVSGANTAYEALRDGLEAMRGELKAIGETRDVAVLQADIAAKKQHPRWLSTKECTEATVAESFTYCQQYTAMQAAQALAEKRDRLKADIKRDAEKLANTPSSAGVAREAGPAAALVGKITGYAFESQAEFMAWLIVCLIELGDIVLPLVMTMVARPSVRRVREERQVEVEKVITAQTALKATKSEKEVRRAAGIASCQAYLDGWTVRDQQSQITATNFYKHYQAVCAHEGRSALSLADFGSIMTGEMGLQKRKNSSWKYLGVATKALPATGAKPKLRVAA
jgi:hypothetical protein